MTISLETDLHLRRPPKIFTVDSVFSYFSKISDRPAVVRTFQQVEDSESALERIRALHVS